MNKSLFKKFLLTTFITLAISACSKKEATDNFDLSNLKLPNRNSKIVKNNSLINKEVKVKNELIPFDKRNEIYSSIKYGKVDPFALVSNSDNKTSSNLIFKGFITTSEENYALINYLGEEGTITENSIGGVNTKYLPNGAKVKFFNLSDSEITIVLGEKELIISINDQLK